MNRQTNPNDRRGPHVAMNESQERRSGFKRPADGSRDGRRGAEIGSRCPDRRRSRRQTRPLDAAGSSPYAQNFNFYLLNDRKTINAFALPGGQIFITRALYDNSKMKPNSPAYSDTRSGTSVHRHSAQQMAKSNLGGALATAAGVGSNDARVAAGAEVARQMLSLSYGRKDEPIRFDGRRVHGEGGLRPACDAGRHGNPEKASGGGGKPEWLSSHPDPETGWKRSSRSSRTNSTIRRLYRRADR